MSVTTILIVGQTPPPYHGQALMVERLLGVPQRGFRLRHVRMAYSRGLHDVGKVQLSKVLHLVRVVVGILYERVRFHPTVLVYHPAGPNVVPIARDIVTLICTRFLFRTTVLYFHAGGIGAMYSRLPRLLRPLFRAAYFGHDYGVQLSTHSPPDAELLRCRHVRFIANAAPGAVAAEREAAEVPRILFVGAVSEEKGIKVLLEAASMLQGEGLRFAVDVVGEFTSGAIERECRDYVNREDLARVIRFHGLRTGAEKAALFASADIFCFPSFYAAESQPLVVMEALQVGLPVVATRWRGIPSEVEDGHNGFLCPTHDPISVAARLRQLIADPQLRVQMGRNARASFADHFSLERYHRDLAAFFEEVGARRAEASGEPAADHP